MAGVSAIFQRLAREGVSTALFEGAKWIVTWLIPLGTAVVTFFGGYLQQTPFVLTMAGTVFVFAATTTGILRFDELRYRRTARDKFIFLAASFAIDYIRDDTGRPTGIERAQVTVGLKNNATFPISYVVYEITSSF